MIMTKKKIALTCDVTLLKAILSFAGPELRDVTEDVHDDLLMAWGICRSVFGAAAKPEHALALLPHYRAMLSVEKPKSGTVEAGDMDEDDSDDDDDEEVEEDEREVFDTTAEVTMLDDEPERRRPRRTR